MGETGRPPEESRGGPINYQTRTRATWFPVRCSDNEDKGGLGFCVEGDLRAGLS
jgi:hypothetical protein